MPKRPKSPEIEEDARYFTVYQPYPLNANWVLEDDQRQCAMWVAECIGVDHLWAIHEKPKSRGMILLEVSRAYTDHSRFLGEHRWAEFLKDPTDEEKPGVTQVFHSFYAHGRDAQKDGWKVINVQPGWFEDWEPGEGDIKQPYPNTHWCPVPVEDKTNKTLCRPLPVEQKPPPPRKHAPVVGSSTWVAKQVTGPPSQAALAATWNGPAMLAAAHTKAKGPIAPPPATDESHWPDVATKKQRSAPPKSAPANDEPTGKSKSKGWGKPVPLKVLNGSTSKATNKKQWDKLVSTAMGGKSPLAEEPPSGPVNAWAKPLKIPPSNRPNHSPRNSTPTSNDNSPWATYSPLDSGGSVDGEPTTPSGALEELPKRESEKRGSANAMNFSKKATSNSTLPRKGQVRDGPPHTLAPADEALSSNERPTGGKGKKRGKHKAALSADAITSSALRSDENKAEESGPDTAAIELTKSLESPSEQASHEEKKFDTKKKVAKPIEDIYTEFNPAPDQDDAKGSFDWSAEPFDDEPAVKTEHVSESPDWGAPPGLVRNPGRKDVDDLANNKSNGKKPESGQGSEAWEGSHWQTRRGFSDKAFDTKGKGRADENSDGWDAAEGRGGVRDGDASANDVNDYRPAQQEISYPDWGAEAEADMLDWAVAGMNFDDPSGEASGSNTWGAPEDANDTWDNVERAPRPTPHRGMDWAARLAADKKKIEALICPTHNIACKKGICIDMARLIRQEELRLAKDRGFKDQKPRPHYVRKTSATARGSFRGRTLVEPTNIAKMRGFEELDREEEQEEQQGPRRGPPPKNSPWQTQSDPSDWL